MSKLRVDELESLESGRSLKVDEMAQTFEYAAGVKITSYTQIIRDSANNLWRVSGATSLPYTLTGAGADEEGTLVGVGDDVLRLSVSGNQTLLVDTASSAVEERPVAAPTIVDMQGDTNINETLNPWRPTLFDGAGSGLVVAGPSITKAVFDVGVKQHVPDLFSRDYHKYKGLFFTGGAGAEYGINLKAWTGNQSLFEDLTFMGYGKAGGWCLNFESQNWWPLIEKFSLSDMGEKTNGIKIVDDGADGNGVIHRESGNSRPVISQARIRYLFGANPNTTGIATSATGAVIRDSAVEAAGIGINLQHPSRAAKIKSCYFEQVEGETRTTSILLGSPDESLNRTLHGIAIHDCYSNLHNQGKFISMGNPTDTIRDLILDNVTLTQTIGQPVVECNDKPAQNIYAGYLSGNTTLLSPALSVNPVHITDTLNRGWFIQNPNGGSVIERGGSVASLPKNAPAALADLWSVITDGLFAYEYIKYSSSESVRLRGATTGIKLTSDGSGTYHAVSAYVKDFVSHAGQWNTLQVLFKTSAPVAEKVFKVKVQYSDGSNETLATNIQAVVADWQEITTQFFLPYSPKLDEDAVLFLEVSGGGNPTLIELTGLRIYEGDVGLCTPTYMPIAAAEDACSNFVDSISVHARVGDSQLVVPLRSRLRTLVGGELRAILVKEDGDVVTGTLGSDGRSASFDLSTHTVTDAVSGYVLVFSG